MENNKDHPTDIAINYLGKKYTYRDLFENIDRTAKAFLKAGVKEGEICFSGKTMMLGYYNNESATNNVIKKHEDGKLWLHTGDIGLMDENGYVYCYGRMKSSINIDGEKIYLFDIANELRREFNLEDCMVEVKKLINDEQSIVVYYVDNSDKISDTRTLLKRINDFLNKKGIVVDGYRHRTCKNVICKLKLCHEIFFLLVIFWEKS